MTTMICPKAKECPYGSIAAKINCPHKTKHEEMVTGCHEISTMFKDCPQHCIPYSEKEEPMKCGTPEEPKFADIDIRVKPNPSPRDIFAHIKTDCERKAFDELMEWNDRQYGCLWVDKLGDSVIYAIKKDHPAWYQWLKSKGLIPRRVVNKVFTGEALAYYTQFVTKPTGLWRRIINAIKAWWVGSQWNQALKAKGLDFKLTDELAVALVVRAMKQDKRGLGRQAGRDQTLEMFVGEKANNIGSKKEAEELRAKGVGAEAVRKQTGWHQGKDGKWLLS